MGFPVLSTDRFTLKKKNATAADSLTLGKMSMITSGKNAPVVHAERPAMIRFAGGQGTEKLLEKHIAEGNDVNVRDSFDRTALHLALYMYGTAESVRLLVKGGADMNLQDKDLRVPLHLACYTGDGRFDAAEEILKLGADPNIPDKLGYTPLHLAAWAGKAQLVRALVASGARLDMKDNDGKTPLDLQTEAVYAIFQSEEVVSLCGGGGAATVKASA